MQIIVKNYQHFNRSLPNWDSPHGKWIGSKKQYDEECKKNNMVSFEEAQEIAEKARLSKIKPYKLSKESEQIIKESKLKSDSKGNVKLSDRAIEALVNKKAIGRKIPDYMKLPSHYEKGGFCAADK